MSDSGLTPFQIRYLLAFYRMMAGFENPPTNMAEVQRRHRIVIEQLKASLENV
jgi:hypothetical protein